ncbi:homing endonuclease [Vibrio phage EniLVp02]
MAAINANTIASICNDSNTPGTSLFDKPVNSIIHTYREIAMKYFGHWIASDDFDPNDYVGFVYLVSTSDGRYYIGSKKLWKNQTRAPNSYKRQPKKPFRESEWLSYTTSSRWLNEDAPAADVEVVEFRILSGQDSWGKTLFLEFMLQVHLDAVRSDKFLNDQAEGQFTKGSWVDDWVKHVQQVKKLLSNPGFKKYPPRPFTIINADGDVHRVNSPWKTAKVLNVAPEKIEKLRVGHLLDADGWKLTEGVRPAQWVSPEGDVYLDEKAARKASGLTVAAFKAAIAEGNWQKHAKESKDDFAARLRSGDLS